MLSLNIESNVESVYWVCALLLFQILAQKLVNAKYCDRFPHVRWKDGQVVHVQVTPELHREYEKKVKLVLEAIHNR